MKEGTSVDQHLKHMKDIADKLAAIGAPISEEDQVVTLLGSLPRSFATLVTAIEARMDGVSLDYIQQVLIHEEMKQLELSGELSGAESALTGALRTFARKFSNIDFFLQILPLKDDELVMSEM